MESEYNILIKEKSRTVYNLDIEAQSEEEAVLIAKIAYDSMELDIDMSEEYKVTVECQDIS